MKMSAQESTITAEATRVGKPRKLPALSTAETSLVQQVLWERERASATAPANNTLQVVRLTGPLDRAALEISLRELAARHAILRTTFGANEGHPPLQLVHGYEALPLAFLDLRYIPENIREQRALDLLRAEAGQRFDLRRLPLTRVFLLRIADQTHLLFLALHPLVCDARSLGVLNRDLSALYRASVTGKRLSLPELTTQYADYCGSSRQSANQADRLYWREQLGERLPFVDLPLDRIRPTQPSGSLSRGPVSSGRKALVESQLARPLLESLGELALQEGTSLSTVLLSALKAVLWRYTRQDDMVVGTPCSTCTDDEQEQLLGNFTHHLALRTNLGGNPTFRELLRRVQTTISEAEAHRSVPFEEIAREITGRATGSWPSLQIQYALEQPAAQLELTGVTSESFKLEATHGVADLLVSITASESDCSVRWEYDTDLFEASRIERMVGHWETLLAGATLNPDRTLDELPLLTERERHQLLVDWNDTSTPLPRESCIHRFFETQAEKTPDAVALFSEDQKLTYGELNAQANRLAHHLRTLGVERGMAVGICLDRSIEMIVSLLAVLKAGGAYVPLDPNWPQDRLGRILDDTQTPVLLTKRRFARHQPIETLQLIDLEEAEPTLAFQSSQNLGVTAEGDDPAYIIFTSGSTGQPKGVVIEHRNLVHSIWSRLLFYPDAVDNCILIPSFAFDASLPAIFGTLCRGGKLSLPATGMENDVVRLGKWIEKQRITHWISTPALYNLLLEQPAARLTSLSNVILGGEACSPALVERHNAVLPHARLYNEYGPTEGTIWCTAYRCSSQARPDGPIPIGRPIHNMQLYVLDENLRPVPIGIPGELHIAGEGVVRGYYQRPELTAEKFIPNPFSDQPDARMYKTGDMVRYLSDGNVEFLGRVDSQVKLRGYRIELGEIETALLRDPAVAETVVLVKEIENQQKHLVAYIVPKRTVSPQRLRRGLRESLPEYMVPSYFVTLDALPVTVNGKIDHRALPLPDRRGEVVQRGYVAPCDELESRLVGIWELVFNLQPIGVCDDFFELGGDSLVAAALFARIDQEFSVPLVLDVLLERPTVRLLATLLRTSPDSEKSYVATIQAGQDRPPLFCLPGIGGNVLEFRRLSQRLDPAQPVYGLPSIGLDGKQPPHRTIQDMASHAIERMRTIQPTGPYYLAGYSLGGVVAFEIARQLHAEGEKIGLLAMLDSRLWSAPVILSPLQKLQLHWHILRNSSNRGRWKYLRERARLFFHRLRRRNLAQSEEDLVEGLELSPASRKVARIHYQAWRDYQPRVYDGRITLFTVANHARHFPMTANQDATLGWARWSTQPVEVHRIRGTHAEMLRSDELQILSAMLSLPPGPQRAEAVM